ncbi:MAG: DNA mismatch repair protein MutL, partial [Bacilli bacterium]|nr:DNA mismatch repair protein MutL [Bacilli bacterium]
EKEEKESFDEKEELIPHHEVKIDPIIPIGSVHGTYIIGYNEKGMYIIDQHAAAERINYEKCYKAILDHSKNIIDLLVPITIELPANEYIILKSHFDILDRLGFIYEEFGDNTIVIRSHPVWIKDFRVNDAIREIIDIIITTDDFSELKFSDYVSMTMACKMSIKGNDARSIEDMEYLLNELVKTNNPYTCPHGRPTIISYTKYDLEKMFKRSM